MSFSLRCYFFIRFVLVTSELITLIKDNEIKCVLTGDSVYSALYISDGTDYKYINRTIPKMLRWLESDWTESYYTGHFLPITDERWIDFGFKATFNVDNSPTPFSVWTNNASSIRFSNKMHKKETNWLNPKTILKDPSNKSNDSENENEREWKNTRIENKTLSVYSPKSASYTYNYTLPVDSSWLIGAALKSNNYTYHYSENTSSHKCSINVGSSNCIIMYVSVDKGCYLNITLESQKTILISKIIQGFNEKNALKEWRRVEIKSNNEQDKIITFYRGTYNNTIIGFWAIDEIKNCSPNIVIYDKTWTNTNIDSNEVVCKLLNSTKENPESLCIHNSSYIGKIGKGCNISCTEILGDSYPFCEKHKICSERSGCQEICESHFWGINCQEKCPHECEICNSKQECLKCKSQYADSGCSKKYSVVKKPPKLISIKPNFIKIAADLEYGSNEARPQYYVIQYKKGTGSEEFKNFGSNNQYTFNKTVNVEMNLTTTETYQIRTILVHHNNKSKQDDVPILIVNKKSLRSTKYNKSSVDLTWEQPIQKHFEYYEIHFKCRKNSSSNSFDENKTTKGTKITINFKNNSFCFIQLYTINAGARTLIDEIDLCPYTPCNILNEELPKSLNLSTHKIIFEESEKFSGPVNYTIEYKCLSNWCQNEAVQTHDHQFNNYSHSISLDVELLPYTFYNISVIAKREGQPAKPKVYSHQRTPPREPHPVENLSIYRRNHNKIWLRWKEHYPPTGQTEMYNATVQNKSVYNTTVFNCTLWKGYVCAVVNYSKTHSDGNFISVSSKNYGVEKYSPGINISITEEFRSSVVENVNVLSSSSPHEIFLVWEYPLYTYGEKIKQFLISVNHTHISRKIADDRTNYNETIRMEYGKQYNINIWAENEFQGEKTNISILFSNPVAKFSSTPFVLWCSTSCYLLLPEKRKETDFTITHNGLNKEKQLDSRNICNNKNSTCTFGINKDDIKNLEFFVNFTHNNNTIRIEFPTKEPIEKKSNVATITVVIVLIFTVLILSFLVVMYCVRKRNKPSRRQETKSETIFFSNLKENDALLESQERKAEPVSVKVSNLEAYLLSALEQNPEENVIYAQFQEIPKITKATSNDGQSEVNVKKNRYTNVLPYDETRVILRNNPRNDYINANYIDGYNTSKVFIATQAPLDSTVYDFWLMIWQENVEVIIMLTELREDGHTKSVQYWPDHHSRLRFGEFLINSSLIKITPNYVHRQFHVRYGNQTRRVHHFQYTTWPDHSIPLSVQDFTMFLKELINDFPQNNPIVVHCNAGCGRTGTFILCDIAIRMATKEKKVDFVSVLTKMREQRTGLVSNEKQYIFAYHVVVEYFFGQDFAITIADNFEEEVAKALSGTSLNLLIQRLDEAKIQYNKIHLKLHSHLTDEEKAKNRFPDIIPGPKQIFLPTTLQNCSNYINAVTVDCYRYPKRFIVTQQPLPDTIQDFWKLVTDYEIKTIISLNKINEEDPLCPVFWPDNPQRPWPLDNTDTLLKFCSKHDNHPTYDLVKVKISKKVKSKSQIINIISVKNWMRGNFQPPSVKDLIYIWKKIMTCNGQIVVTCYDGATASGLFVALAYLLEKINMDHKCDVYTAVNVVQQSRSQFVEHSGQLRLLYQTALQYIQEFSTYGNFN